MGISKDIVKYVANLSYIKLNRKEEEKLSKQLEDIIQFIDKLKEVDISLIESASHILPISNVFREDKLKESINVKEVLKNAPEKRKDFFVVPKVIGK